jgi:hypothetical protein
MHAAGRRCRDRPSIARRVQARRSQSSRRYLCGSAQLATRPSSRFRGLLPATRESRIATGIECATVWCTSPPNPHQCWISGGQQFGAKLAGVSVRKIGYARVSSTGQNLDRQLGALVAEGCDRIFQEKVSGKSIKNRPELEKAISALGTGDVLVLAEWDRCTRSMIDGVAIIDSAAPCIAQSLRARNSEASAQAKSVDTPLSEPRQGCLFAFLPGQHHPRSAMGRRTERSCVQRRCFVAKVSGSAAHVNGRSDRSVAGRHR